MYVNDIYTLKYIKLNLGYTKEIISAVITMHKPLKLSSVATFIARKGRQLLYVEKHSRLVPLTVFLILCIPIGLFFALNTPAMWAPDGGAQVARVFQIADGGFDAQYINHDHGVGYGGEVPVNVNNLKNLELSYLAKSGIPGAERENKILTSEEKTQIKTINDQKISKQKILISFINTAAYSPIAYLPSVIGVKLGMIVNLTVGHTLLIAGLLGFLVYLISVSYTLFTLRSSQLKWVIMVVALLPLAIFQTTVITADSLLMSIGILFSGLIIKALFSDMKLSIADKCLLYLSVLILPQLKSVYFPLIFLILLIPKNNWRKKKYYWLWLISALVISTIGFGYWSLLSSGVAASAGLVRGDTLWVYGDASIQEHFILTHPLGFLHAIVNSVIYQSNFYINTYFSWLSFAYLPIPGIAQVAGFMALGLSVFLSGIIRAKKTTTIALISILIIVVLLIFTVLYVTYSLPRNSYVEGIQGRYFLPITALAIVATAAIFPKLRIKRVGLDTAKLILVSLCTICLLLSGIRYGVAII